MRLCRAGLPARVSGVVQKMCTRTTRAGNSMSFARACKRNSRIGSGGDWTSLLSHTPSPSSCPWRGRPTTRRGRDRRGGAPRRSPRPPPASVPTRKRRLPRPQAQHKLPQQHLGSRRQPPLRRPARAAARRGRPPAGTVARGGTPRSTPPRPPPAAPPVHHLLQKRQRFGEGGQSPPAAAAERPPPPFVARRGGRFPSAPDAGGARCDAVGETDRDSGVSAASGGGGGGFCAALANRSPIARVRDF